MHGGPHPTPTGEYSKTMPNLIRDAAKYYNRQHGLWVFPCEGKKPVLKNWPNQRLDLDDLDRWFRNGHNFNVAFALNQSPWIDVECDSPEAEANLQSLCGGRIPPTPTYISKRGKHRIFVRPKGVPNTAALTVDGIEFRGLSENAGACSILPPSMHPEGGRYRWEKGLSLDDLEPAELPRDIVARLGAVASKIVSSGSAGPIPEGKRNDTLFRRARDLRAAGLDADALLSTIFALNGKWCDPPLPDREVREIVHSVMKQDLNLPDFLSQLLETVELWHDENGEPFATLTQNGHRENWPINKRSRPFCRWLSKEHYRIAGAMLKEQALSDVLCTLEGNAVYDGPEHEVWRRVAARDDTIYIDLCDERWRAIEVKSEGWRIVDQVPVKFRRAKAMLALPEPVQRDGEDLWELLRPFLNIREDQWPLVAAWLIAALRPTGPYPLLKLQGEQGSAKTTTAKVLRALIDPNRASVRAEPKDTRDLMITANNNWVLCLDNLSILKQDLSDALCRLATGGGFATRSLYSNDEETIFDAQRPIMLTSIEDVGIRPDLLERSLIIELPTIEEEHRRPEKTFWLDFADARPQILGALISALAGTLGRLSEIENRQSVEMPRMADFYNCGRAAEEPLGLPPCSFKKAYAANRESATQIVLQSSPLIPVLMKCVERHGRIEGTAEELKQKLEEEARRGVQGWEREHGWPKTAHGLSSVLKRCAPNLREMGISAVPGVRGSGNNKRKIWIINGADGKRTIQNPPA